MKNEIVGRVSETLFQIPKAVILDMKISSPFKNFVSTWLWLSSCEVR